MHKISKKPPQTLKLTSINIDYKILKIVAFFFKWEQSSEITSLCFSVLVKIF